MKEKIKVFLKKLTNILLLIVSCLLVAAMVFIQSKQMNTLSASAEEASTVADVESGIDLTQYPSANLFPISSFDFSGVALNEKFVFDLNGTYTFSYTENFSSVANKASLISVKVDGVEKYCSATTTANRRVTLTYTGHIIEIRFLNWCSAVGTISEIMFNVGPTAYPFMPNLNSIYNSAYGRGYNQGKEEGLDYARAGYWLDVTVGVDFAGTSNGVEVSDNLVIHPTVTSMGIDLSNVYTEINAKYPNLVLRRCMFALYFPECVIVENLKLRCIGDEGILTDDQLYCYLYDFGTDEYEGIRARFAYIDGSSTVSGIQFAMSTGTEAELEELNSKRLCYISSSAVQNISQFKGLRFYTTDTLAGINYEAGRVAGYNAGSKESYEAGKTEGFELGKEEGQLIGFEAGKTEGFELGKEEGFETGKSEGYEAGKDDGYNKGLKEGELIGREKAISEGVDGSGLLYALFALLKLFFTLLSDMMSLKIAGDFTVGFFVIGIPATFMIINLVIKLVNRSSGGSE